MRQLINTPGQVGEIFRGRRKSRRVSQEELASKLSISQSQFSLLEINPERLTLDRLILLAKLLGFELVLQDRSELPKRKDDW